MRAFLNAILEFIGTTSLTDEEFATVETELQIYDQDSYDALLSIIDARETMSNTRDRLTAYYLARGVTVEETSSAASNIWAGSVLE